jgi:hypothetical protein
MFYNILDYVTGKMNGTEISKIDSLIENTKFSLGKSKGQMYIQAW